MTEKAVIHVIDDDDAVRQSLAFLLSTVGYEVEEHPSARAFANGPLAAVNASAGCIITDVRMPDMTGIELLELIQQRGLTVPVIVITGHGDVPLAVAAMKLGAADFLEKPFDDVAILDTVKSALERGRAVGPLLLYGHWCSCSISTV